MNQLGSRDFAAGLGHGTIVVCRGVEVSQRKAWTPDSLISRGRAALLTDGRTRNHLPLEHLPVTLGDDGEEGRRVYRSRYRTSHE